MIVAIDGTVSSGKSTIARKLAEHLKFLYLNTGAIYRAITIKILNKGYTEDNVNEIFNMLQWTVITASRNEKSGKVDVFLDGVDVTQKIVTPFISQNVSRFSKIPEVREYVRQVQLRLANAGDCVIEGRDIGTVVFPNAEVKIFMTADLEVRARRRLNDYLEQGKNVTINEVQEEIRLRDKADMEREISPLKPAEDAIIYQNNGNNINVVVLELAKIVNDKKDFLTKG